MNKYILITCATDNEDVANNIAEILLKERLISCCQISNINSSYHWKGNVEHSKEYLLQMKTKKELYNKVEKVILENHNYELPEIVAYDINIGYDKFFNWIETETISDTNK